MQTLKLNGLKMQFLEFNDPLVVIVGPTAVGKTAFAVEVAKKLDGEVVSADSRLFYRRMDIGTAKPPLEDLAGVPHHLIDVAEPDEPWSLVLFQEQAQKVIASIHAHGKLPFLVGGTGQYIKAVIEGWQAPLQQPDFEMRQILETWGSEIGPHELHNRLGIIDPEAAKHIEPGNLRRTVRALEVIFKTGSRFSEQRMKSKSPYSICVIGLKRPRAELYMRIDSRIDQMIAAGLMDEVKNLLVKGFSPNLPTLSAIGYREMIAVINGTISMDEAIMQMKRLTRQFVRRQSNWFKESDPNIHWLDANQPTDAAVKLIQSSAGWIKKME